MGRGGLVLPAPLSRNRPPLPVVFCPLEVTGVKIVDDNGGKECRLERVGRPDMWDERNPMRKGRRFYGCMGLSIKWEDECNVNISRRH